MSTFVYVYGTNGTGKTSLARALAAQAGGFTVQVPWQGKASYTETALGMTLVGRYGNACGGVDGIQPYADAAALVRYLGEQGRNVMAEGLVQPGWRTCVDMAAAYDAAHFILLEEPEDKCIANVLRRRQARGNTKPYDPGNLRRKAASARSWANLIRDAGLTIHRLNWRQAYSLITRELGLPGTPDHLL